MSLLTDIIARPALINNLSNAQWDQAISFSRYARLLGAVNMLVEGERAWDAVPVVAREALSADEIYVDYIQLQARREFRALERAFATAEYPVVLLKGSAYICAELPPAQGRRLSDVDILVPPEQLALAEKTLLEEGWESDESLTEYDQHYYREWSHEVPPLRHRLRQMEVDLHHTLTQPTGRIKLDAGAIWKEIVPIENSGFHRLSNRDLFLHSATHLFINDELRGGLRDLVDMHFLATKFSRDPGFWEDLLERAQELDLTRPLYYALTMLHSLFATAIPASTLSTVQGYGPNIILRSAMSHIITRVLAPEDSDKLRAPFYEFVLFVRSHWIRMPPAMLFRHLWHKWRYQLASRRQSDTVGE